jgi:hypothetical protein
MLDAFFCTQRKGVGFWLYHFFATRKTHLLEQGIAWMEQGSERIPSVRYPPPGR